MVKDDIEASEYGRGSFSIFMKCLKKLEWSRDINFPYSFFHQDRSNYIHARIIRFNGVGMTLGFISYIKFTIWQHKNKLYAPNKNTYKW